MNSSSTENRAPSPAAPHIPDHEVLQRIGHGSYGEVWLARSLTGAWRAVKVVYRHTFDDERPYEREFRGISKYEPVSCGHDGLVRILHVGRARESKAFYYIMELADDVKSGQTIDPASYEPRTLRGEIRRRGRLPVEECLAIGSVLASALDHLHSQGLVHRDVKPSNIIFVRGQPKLADVGLVTDADRSVSYVGTEGYVAPEGPTSPQADLYSLGKVIYELSTGRDRQQFPDWPTDITDPRDNDALVRLNELTLRACDRNPERRYRTGAEMTRDFALLQQGATLEPLGAKARRRRRWALGIAFLALAALLCLASLWFGTALQLKSSFGGPDATYWGQARVMDWDGDGDQEIVVGRQQGVSVFTTSGVATNGLLLQGVPENADEFSLNWLVDDGRPGSAQPAVSWRIVDQLHLAVLNRQGKLVQSFTNTGHIYRDTNGEPSASMWTAARVADLNGDGKRELLAILTMGEGGTQRGLCCLSFESGANLWTYLTAPKVHQVECIEVDGKQQIVLGTMASSNRVHVADTSDAYSYLFVLRPDGTPAWSKRLWDHYSQSHLIIDAEREAIYVWSLYSGEALRTLRGEPPQGHIVCYRYSGEELGHEDFSQYLGSCWLSDATNDGRKRLLATDRDGYLHRLPLGLSSEESEEKVRVAKKQPWPIRLEFLTEGDLDGDGRNEIVLLCYGLEYVSGRDETGRSRVVQKTEPSRVVENQHDPTILVLDSRLRTIGTHGLGELWTSSVPVTAWVGQLQKGDPPRLLVLADKVLVLGLTRGLFPRLR